MRVPFNYYIIWLCHSNSIQKHNPSILRPKAFKWMLFSCFFKSFILLASQFSAILIPNPLSFFYFHKLIPWFCIYNQIKFFIYFTGHDFPFGFCFPVLFLLYPWEFVFLFLNFKNNWAEYWHIQKTVILQRKLLCYQKLVSHLNFLSAASCLLLKSSFLTFKKLVISRLIH